MMNVPAPQLQVFLQFVSGPLAGQTRQISKQDTRIGSDPGLNDIVILDTAIQPQHARFLWNDGRIEIEAHSPQSIMTVNRLPVDRAEIHNGDEISLGWAGIKFRLIVNSEAQRVRPATDLKYTETTRYLCAAANLDEKFRKFVTRHIIREEHRAVGESYGVDVVPVVKCSLAAGQRAFTRDLVLLGLLLIGLVVVIQNILSFTSGGPFSSVYTPYSLTGGPDLAPLVIRGVILLIIILIVLVALVVFPSSRRIPLVPLALLVAILLFFPLIGLLFLLAWTVVGIELGISYYGSYAKQLTKGNFRPDHIVYPISPSLEQKLRAIFHTQDGNVVVYSGFSPFAGAGFYAGGWSFAVDATKGKQELGATRAPVPFKVSEMYDCVADVIKGLGLSNVSLEDKLYVNGQEIRNDRRFLDHPFARPNTQVAPSLMKEFMESPTEDIRYYKCIRVTSWRGELIVSIFLRFSMAGKNLYMEADYLLLPPLKEEYYTIDTIEPALTGRKIWELVAQSFYAFFPDWLFSPVRVLSWALRDWLTAREHKNVERLIRDNPAFDYGTSTSLRQFASSSEYRRYFQRLDKEMYVKIIERQILESIVNFLDARNIDTTDLKERQETILNNGVIVTGGAFTAENIAVGERARAVFTSVNGSAKGATGTSPQQTSKQQTSKS